MEQTQLEQYLQENGVPSPEPSLASLSALQSSHAARYSFNNIAVLLGDPLPLDTSALFHKIITRNRGGYCFEHNKLFYDVLETLGFSCAITVARVLNNRTVDVPRTHRVTLLSLAGKRYLVDVGFGPNTPLAPLALCTAEPQRQGSTLYRIVQPSEGNYLLEMEKKGTWFSLYSFDLATYTEADCLCGHHYSSTHPQAVFCNNLVVARRDESVIRSLRNGSFHKSRDGVVEVRTIATAAQLSHLLQEEFQLQLRAEEVQGLFDRFCAASGE